MKFATKIRFFKMKTVNLLGKLLIKHNFNSYSLESEVYTVVIKQTPKEIGIHLFDIENYEERLTLFLGKIQEISGKTLNTEQIKAVVHNHGPLMIMAGPGSGKTEVLVLRTLKLILVDNVQPESIILTTFTRKAAKMIRDRISRYLASLGYAEIIDSSLIWMGTLHSLCDEIMKTFRYLDYSDRELMDEIQTMFFAFRNGPFKTKEREIWAEIFTNLSITGYASKWDYVEKALTIINRITQDRLDLDKMENHSETLRKLISFYYNFQVALKEKGKCDFATVQKLFVDFLETPHGSNFLKGSSERGIPCIEHIMVDEYQDTNPIQEEIYFKLASFCKNLVVVGDDDQALYRFRGGTVDCLIRFPEFCEKNLNLKPSILQLIRNYRSHDNIINWLNEYISSFPFMQEKNARAPKEPLIPSRELSSDYHVLSVIIEQNAYFVGETIAEVISNLYNSNIIEDYSQVALLFYSVIENGYHGISTAGIIANALRMKNIPIYNPRSRDYLDRKEIKIILGALVKILSISDSNNTNNEENSSSRELLLENWLYVFENSSRDYPELHKYVNESINAIKSPISDNLENINLRTILYRIYSYDPFKSWLADPEISLNLAQFTQLLESYADIYNDYLWNKKDSNFNQNINGNIIFVFIDFLRRYGLNSNDDEERQILPNHVQMMTFHQAKGLEFPFVFVGSMKKKDKHELDTTYILEEIFESFRLDGKKLIFNMKERISQDLVRLFYVAYSRAEYGLILHGSKGVFSKSFGLGGRDIID